MTAPTGHDSIAAFVVPGPPPDRERAEGWEAWRVTRHRRFAPAPRIDLAAWRVMSPQARALHDLHRAATHANLPFQETPMSAAVSRVMWSRIRSNAAKVKPTTRAGLMVNGGGNQGKTETVCEVAALFADQWLALYQANPDAVAGTRDLHAPVAYVQTPVTAKPKSTCEAILDFYGAGHHRMTLPQLVHAVRASLYDHATRVLILDDITRLRMHREADQDVLDLLRALMSMNITLVLVGIPASGLLREGRHDPRTGAWTFPGPAPRHRDDEAATQTERRFDLVDLGPFSYDTPAGIAAWLQHLAGIEDSLRLLHPADGTLTTGSMPEYLFRRTGGVVGLLERLIEDGCAHAMDTGSERLDIAGLDEITLNLGNVPLPAPAVPRSTRAGGRRKGRNTVFDEHLDTADAAALDDVAVLDDEGDVDDRAAGSGRRR